MALDMNMFGSSGGGLWGDFDPFGQDKSKSTGTGQDLQKLLSQYMGFVQDPASSSLYQNQLTGLLQALVPSEQQAQTNLADMFRGAGNMASSQFGQSASRLQGDILRNRQTLASQLLGQMFPQMAQALQMPISLEAQLMQALKSQQAQQQARLMQPGPQSSGGGGIASNPSDVFDPGSGRWMTSGEKTRLDIARTMIGGDGGGGGGGGLLEQLLGGRGGGGGGAAPPPSIPGGTATWIGPEGFITGGGSSVFGPGTESYDPFAGVDLFE